jgi:aldose sugar dehydrogenase
VYLISIYGKTSLPFFVMLILIPIEYAVNSAYGQFSGSQPVINDASLKADLVFQRLRNPTSMVFLGRNDILVLEKDQGTVQRIVNGNMLPKPALHVVVATAGERGMLGIAIAKDTTTNGTTAKFVYLYHTNAGAHLGNHVYRYEFVGNKLINPKR